MRENREIVLSEQEIQDICNDFGAKLSKDLANEEKVHIGELKKCLELIGVSDKEQQEGEDEVEEIVGNVGKV